MRMSTSRASERAAELAANDRLNGVMVGPQSDPERPEVSRRLSVTRRGGKKASRTPVPRPPCIIRKPDHYNRLQISARYVISDSRTVSEESSILGFPAITLRDSIERSEALDSGAIVMTGLIAGDVIEAIEFQVAANHEERILPAGYEINGTSLRVVRFMLSTARRHSEWACLRSRPTA